MNEKIAKIDRFFSVLSIVFSIIAFILLILNCFIDVIYEVLFIFIFVLISVINQLLFLPGKIRIKDREYQQPFLFKCQFYTAMLILVMLLLSSYYSFGDVIDLCLEGSLLMIFLVFFSLQSFFYTYNYNKKNKLHFGRRVILSVFLSSFLLITLLWSFILAFRG